jgi:hypothetical protein
VSVAEAKERSCIIWHWALDIVRRGWYYRCYCIERFGDQDISHRMILGAHLWGIRDLIR